MQKKNKAAVIFAWGLMRMTTATWLQALILSCYWPTIYLPTGVYITAVTQSRYQPTYEDYSNVRAGLNVRGRSGARAVEGSYWGGSCSWTCKRLRLPGWYGCCWCGCNVGIISLVSRPGEFFLLFALVFVCCWVEKKRGKRVKRKRKGTKKSIRINQSINPQYKQFILKFPRHQFVWDRGQLHSPFVTQMSFARVLCFIPLC